MSVTPRDVAELVALIDGGELTDKLGRQVLEGVLAGEGDPAAVVVSRGLRVVSDEGVLLAAVEGVIAGHPDVVDRIRGGRVQAVGALVGGVMKVTGGQADAARVRELLLERLGL